MDDVVISIKPRYATLILSGVKTVELRKASAKLAAGTRVLIYASSPTRALVGQAIIAERHQLPLEKLWSRYGQAAAISRSEFERYYSGDEEGVAFDLRAVRQHDETTSLDELRRLGGGFRPPQSYMRQPRFLQRLAERRAWWLPDGEQVALAL